MKQIFYLAKTYSSDDLIRYNTRWRTGQLVWQTPSRVSLFAKGANVRPTLAVEALYTQTIPPPGKPHPMTRAQTTETQTPLLGHLSTCIIGHNLVTLKGPRLTVTTKLARGGGLLESIGGIGAWSFYLIFWGGESPGGRNSPSRNWFRDLQQ